MQFDSFSCFARSSSPVLGSARSLGRLLSVVPCLLLGLGLVACEAETSSTPQVVKSRIGESCAASNDCGSGAVCMEQVCVQGQYPVAATAKQCIAWGCTTTDDCCAKFEPAYDKDECDYWEQECKQYGYGCSTFDAYCVCKTVCEDSQCVAATNSCASDQDCTGGSFCDKVAKKCIECKTDDNCAMNELCQNKVCVEICARDEDCPLFNACKDGSCNPTGCVSDRECILLVKDSRATCKAGVCGVPCKTNTDCPELNLCNDGTCVYLGCETDAECVNVLKQSMGSGDYTAKCLAPTQL